MRARFAVLGVALLAASLAGCLREPQQTNHIRIVGIDVAAPRVSSGTVLLVVNTTLDNSGGGAGPVDLIAKAFASDTGLLEATNQSRLVGIPKDKSVAVAIGLDVPRRAGYRIELAVHEDGRLVQEGQVTASNIAALQPNLFDTGLHLGTMDFLVRNVTGNRVTIEAGIHVTNEAAEVPRPLRMVVKAREVSTGLLSDQAETTVQGVRPEETHVVEVSLDVPNGYNYEVEATLWDGNITVGRGEGRVQLLPNFTKDKSQDIVVTRPEIRDFVRGDEAGSQESNFAGSPGGALDRGFSRREGAGQATPGAPLALLLLALGGIALLARRRRHG